MERFSAHLEKVGNYRAFLLGSLLVYELAFFALCVYVRVRYWPFLRRGYLCELVPVLYTVKAEIFAVVLFSRISRTNLDARK